MRAFYLMIAALSPATAAPAQAWQAPAAAAEARSADTWKTARQRPARRSGRTAVIYPTGPINPAALTRAWEEATAAPPLGEGEWRAKDIRRELAMERAATR